jgi:hypothetical protein
MSLVSQTDCQPHPRTAVIQPGVFAYFPLRRAATVGSETFTSRIVDTNVGPIS